AQLVRRSQIKMRQILNAIEEGIVTIDPHFKIEAEYSIYLRKMFRQTDDLAGQDIVQLIYPGASHRSESASMMRETLRACMEEDEIGWDLNAHHLPQELNVSILGQDKHLLLSWQPLTNKHGQIINILLSIRDNTERRRMEKNLQTYELEQQLLQELFGNPLNLIGDVLARAEAVMSWSDPSASTRLHTIKGEARALGLNTLSAAVHVLEDGIRTSEEAQPDPIEVEKFRQLLDRYQKILHHFSHSAAAKADQESSLLAAVQPLLRAAKNQFEQANLTLERIEVIDGIVDWPEAAFKDVTDIVLHALTNSIDHGFMIPAQAGLKVAHPRLSISCEKTKGHWRILVRDNGIGLNLEKLRALSESRGFRPTSDQTWTDVVFEVGVSTAENLTISSGRGLGMAAVREIAQKRGGQVRIRPAPSGTGTELEVLLRDESAGTAVISCAG
ncbi:MAG: ATP-binding protein, partial [Pseudobdellovibrionaceae bacterium]|nr:ATP-binding protein [Pseudobdellovibrionaceae bacterium]